MNVVACVVGVGLKSVSRYTNIHSVLFTHSKKPNSLSSVREQSLYILLVRDCSYAIMCSTAVGLHLRNFALQLHNVCLFSFHKLKHIKALTNTIILVFSAFSRLELLD